MSVVELAVDIGDPDSTRTVWASSPSSWCSVSASSSFAFWLRLHGRPDPGYLAPLG
ncbi:MAG: hypothetical protein R2697_10860 [Ilumatobacteraceae bacterium]